MSIRQKLDDLKYELKRLQNESPATLEGGGGKPFFAHSEYKPKTIQVTTPAVDTDWTFKNNTGYNLLIRVVHFRYSADANAGNREVTLETFDEYGLPDLVIEPPRYITAGQLVDFYVGVGLQSVGLAGGLVFNMAFPSDFVLVENATIGSGISGDKAGDQINAITLRVIQFR